MVAATGPVVHHATPNATRDTTPDALVATLRETIADLKRERDDWKEPAMRLALPELEPEPIVVVEVAALERSDRRVRP
jgi:hypothetical protein